VVHRGESIYFCSDRCRVRFEADPARFVQGTGAERMPDPHTAMHSEPMGSEPEDQALPSSRDPVCGMSVDPADPGGHLVHEGRDVYFCGAGCRDAFAADPEAHPLDISA